MTDEPLAADLLRGADQIAAYIGIDRRQCYYLVRTGALPVFRLGTVLCARKSTLLDWIAKREAATGAAA